MISLIVTVLAAKTSCLLFGGDIMLNGIPPSDKTFQGIQALTASCDLSFANLEIPITSSTTRTRRKTEAELKQHNQWILKADPKHMRFLAQSGINIVSLANNHAMDYGPDGLKEMEEQLDACKIQHAGADATAPLAMAPTFAKLPNQKTVALLSCLGFMTTAALRKTTPATMTSPGVGVLNLAGNIDQKARAKLQTWVASAKAHADYVVVAIHWGIERKPLPTPYQVALGRALIDAGADVVWGNHPHVLQGAEMYKGRLIMYSMGNLVSSLPATTGFFKLQIAEDGTQTPVFIPAKDASGRIAPVKESQQKAAIRSMRALCRLLLRRYPSTVSVPAL